MDQMCRSEGEAQLAPAARKSVKTRPAQPCHRAPNIGEPEQEKRPPRGYPQSQHSAPVS
jgi:hypothetical protein